MEQECKLQAACNELNQAIDMYNAAYQATISHFPNYEGPTVRAYSGPSLDVATQRYERCAREFNKLAKEDMARTGQVSSLVTEMRQRQRDNGFWTRELDAIINNQQQEKE